MSARFISFHALKNFPLSRPNADDMGEQKTSEFGGVRRSRISSQCIKHAVRNHWRESFGNNPEKMNHYVGIRTSFIVDTVKDLAKNYTKDENVIGAVCKAVVSYFFDDNFGVVKEKKNSKKSDLKNNKDDKNEVVVELSTKEKKGTTYLIFSSVQEINSILKFVFSKLKSVEDLKKTPKELKAFFKDFKSVTGNEKPSITADVAMSGRMQANAADFEVRAALQVAHAISVNSNPEEFDYFAAVDDLKENATVDDGSDYGSGAGHISSLSCNSSCYYFHANICIDKLVENLGGNKKMAYEAAVEMVKSLALSNPSGKQNTFDHHVFPDFIMVEIHDGQSVNLVNAFEVPVEPRNNQGLTENAIARLLNYRAKTQHTFGDLYPSGTTLISCTKEMGEIDPKIKLPFSDLCKQITTILEKQ